MDRARTSPPIPSWRSICAPTCSTRWRWRASRCGALGQVYEQRAELSPYGLALLGLALEQAKDARAGEIAAALEQTVQQDAEQAWWTATRDQMLDFSEDVTPEATAYAVKFLSHQRPNCAAAAQGGAVADESSQRRLLVEQSTKQTAMVIYGLTDYLKATGELNPNLTATVFVNDEPVLTRKLDQAAALGLPELTLDESKLQPGVNHIRVVTTRAGTALLFRARRILLRRRQACRRPVRRRSTFCATISGWRRAKDGDKIVYDTGAAQRARRRPATSSPCDSRSPAPNGST